MSIVIGVIRRLLRIFVSGALAMLPIVVTVAVVAWVVNFVAQYVGPETSVGKLLAQIGLSLAPDGAQTYIIGWLVVLGVIFLFGVFIELGAKKYFKWITSFFFSRIPIIGSLYDTSQKFVEMFETNDNEALKGMSAVYCFFGEGGPAVLAFLASPTIFKIEGQEYQIVVIPTAPVPFGGGMLFMPVKNIKAADMSVDGLMSTYISMGVTADKFVQTDAGKSS